MIHTNGTVEETTNSNYINSKNNMISETWALNATEIFLAENINYLLLLKIYKIKLIIKWQTI